MNNITINKILYDEDEIIQIEDKLYEYSFIYYLSLLIKDNKDFVNFSFGIDFIKKVDGDKGDQENGLKKMFLSKIILDFIFNYEGTKEKEEEELKKNKEKNIMYINENINEFNNYNLNLEKIKEISLEKLYLYILIELIENKKLENYDFAHDILTNLDFENIDLNLNMLEKLKTILNDERYINDYKIEDLEDFFMEKKINFYYILIKYIYLKILFSFIIFHYYTKQELQLLRF